MREAPHSTPAKGLSKTISMDITALHVLLVIFLATLIRSAFGFGEALIAVPLLALRIPLAIAAPLAVLMSITIAAVVVVQDWEKIHVRSTGWLVGSTLLGIPLGLLLLTSIHKQAVKAALAIFLMIFSASLFLANDRRNCGRIAACGS